MVVNKFIIDIRIEILYLHQTRFSYTNDSSVTFELNKVIKAKKSTMLNSFEDQNSLKKLLNNLFFIFSHGVVSLFSIYEFDCPSDIFRPSSIPEGEKP